MANLFKETHCGGSNTELYAAWLSACCSLFSPKEGAPALFSPPVSAQGEHRLSPFRQTLTGDGEHVGLDLSLDLEATSPLGVIRPTQAGHVGHAAFVDVHHTVWIEARIINIHTFECVDQDEQEEVMMSLTWLRQHCVSLDDNQGSSPLGCSLQLRPQPIRCFHVTPRVSTFGLRMP